MAQLLAHAPWDYFACIGGGVAFGIIAVRLRDYLIVRRALRKLRARITVGGLV